MELSIARRLANLELENSEVQKRQVRQDIYIDALQFKLNTLLLQHAALMDLICQTPNFKNYLESKLEATDRLEVL